MPQPVVVACDAHPFPLTVARFVRDESGVWRQVGHDASVVAREKIRLRCPWCQERLTVRGRRLASLLGKQSVLTLADLASGRRLRRR